METGVYRGEGGGAVALREIAAIFILEYLVCAIGAHASPLLSNLPLLSFMREPRCASCLIITIAAIVCVFSTISAVIKLRAG